MGTSAALGRLEHMTGHRKNKDHLASSHHQDDQDDFTPSSQMDSGGWMGKGNTGSKGRGTNNTGGKSAYFNKKSWGWKGQAGGKKRKESAARGNSPKRRSTGSSSATASSSSSSGSARPSVGSMGLPRKRF